jgi:hypothetical protein
LAREPVLIEPVSDGGAAGLTQQERIERHVRRHRQWQVRDAAARTHVIEEAVAGVGARVLGRVEALAEEVAARAAENRVALRAVRGADEEGHAALLAGVDQLDRVEAMAVMGHELQVQAAAQEAARLRLEEAIERGVEERLRGIQDQINLARERDRADHGALDEQLRTLDLSQASLQHQLETEIVQLEKECEELTQMQDALDGDLKLAKAEAEQLRLAIIAAEKAKRKRRIKRLQRIVKAVVSVAVAVTVVLISPPGTFCGPTGNGNFVCKFPA